jgi:hypothetical protein
MSTPPRQPTEEELRAAYEAEIKKLRVEDVLLQTVVSLINLGGRKAGLAPGSEDERDPAQLQRAIDAAMALLPLIENDIQLQEAAQLRQALSQLQMTYAKLVTTAGGGEAAARAGDAGAAGADGGQAGAGGQPAGGQQAQRPTGPGPAQASGRLWVPGQ